MVRKRLTDEQIVLGLIECGSIRATAQKLGCNERTLYERMKKDEFQKLYLQAKGDIIKNATSKLQGNLTKAIDTLSSIMTDESTASQTRVNCATSILSYCQKYTETADIILRIENIEKEYRERKGNSIIYD